METVPAWEVTWQKGQTHLHSNRSGDGRTPPADVVRWYAAHGFDFIVFTDHNVVTHAPPGPPGMLVFTGAELTWNADTCGPPEVPCRLHVNALFATPPGADTRVTVAPEASDRATVYHEEITQAAALGGLAQLNHPNYHYGANAALLAALARQGLRLVEFSNASIDCMNEGDSTHADTEALWNQVLDTGVDVWNVASDDAHHFDDAAAVQASGATAFAGNRGWVMVRAEHDARSLREAMARGEFYASTGVTVREITVTEAGYAVTVGGDHAERTVVRFVGTGGRTLATMHGPVARLPIRNLSPETTWVRATVTDTDGRQAWTQPVRVHRDGGQVRVTGPFANGGPSTEPTVASPARAGGAAEPPGTTHWTVRSGDAGGRGGGSLEMTRVREGDTVTFAYPGGTMHGTEHQGRVTGTWTGHTGSGWWEAVIAQDDQTLVGAWGYGTDHAHPGGMFGTRR